MARQMAQQQGEEEAYNVAGSAEEHLVWRVPIIANCWNTASSSPWRGRPRTELPKVWTMN